MTSLGRSRANCSFLGFDVRFQEEGAGVKGLFGPLTIPNRSGYSITVKVSRLARYLELEKL